MRRKKRLTVLMLCAALTLSTGISTACAADASAFSDVDSSSWYAEAAAYCQENGLMEGSGGVFSPETSVTRAVLTAALYRAAGSPDGAGVCGFPDISEDEWYADAACWAGAEGIVTGDENGLFAGEEPVTRQDAAVLLWRCAGSPETAPASGFKDEDEAAPYARAAIDWARNRGIITGFPDGRFGPRDNATRAQAAEMLMRYWQYLNAVIPEVLDVADVRCEPRGIAVMEDGALLVSDTYNKVLWRVYDGESAVYAGGQSVPDIHGQPVGGYYDGSLTESSFRTPWAVAPFLGGYAVADAANGAVRLIRDGKVQTLNCTVSGQDLPVNANGGCFSYPTGLAAGDDGCLYVSDTHENAIRKITPEGVVSTFADGLSDPMGLCWKDGALYVAETGANRVLKITDGKVSVAAGTGEDGCVDGAADEAAFSLPQGVAVDDSGTIYVADTGNGAVRRIQDGVVTTLYTRDAADLDALYPVSPVGLLLADGRLYVCDSFARKILIIPL